ncbi:variant surface protein (VSG), putative [Trypanosoma equiperdum]|uniref:Variant surface protein (VSG), putative n=1 Tax=Trypanosoma equiperdum TaxID=5694 RepID=A0A1G4IGQ0_TRYEQ|nr:variant surface protein (VSG), putative [Trypanosoma equiperdum]
MAAYKTSDRNASIVHAAAAEASHTCVTSALENLENLYSTGIMTTAKAGQTIGHVEEFITLLKTASKGGATTGYCLNSGNTNAPTTDTRINGDECTELEFDTTAAPMVFEGEHIDKSGFKTFKNQDVITGQATKCSLLEKSGGGAANAADIFQSDGTHNLVQGLLTVTAKSAASHAATFTKQDAIASDWVIQKPTDQLQKLYVAIAEAKKAIETQTNCRTDAKSVIQHVIGDGKTTREIEKYLKAIYPAEKKDTATNDARTMIDKVAGTSNNQKTKIQEQIVSTGATKVQGTTAESKQLKDISGNDQLQTAFLAQRAELNEASSSAAKACQSQNTASTKITETDESCQKKGTGDACKDGCKVEGTGENKKCVKNPSYKPKKKVEEKR